MHNAFFDRHGWHLTSHVPPHTEGAWEPAVDLYRCAGGWILKFELAGVRQEDIEVRLEAGGVTVLGTRFDRLPYPIEKAHSMEIAYSRFARFVALPEAIHEVQYRVEFHDGMLYVQVLQSNAVASPK